MHHAQDPGNTMTNDIPPHVSDIANSDDALATLIGDDVYADAIAFGRGQADFRNRHFINPYDSNTNEFRAWIAGWRHEAMKGNGGVIPLRPDAPTSGTREDDGNGFDFIAHA